VPGTNWAGNLAYRAERVHRPSSVDELRALVASAPRLKALGTRHCFNDIADTEGGDQVDVSALPPLLEMDTERATALVGAAQRYGDLTAGLDRAGFALGNLASLPHISVAGAVATATHGSGQAHRALSSAVSAVEMVTADGELRRWSRAEDPAVFPGVVVGLGALGVVTSLTLDLVPRFDARQDLFQHLDWDAAVEHFDAIQQAGYSVSLFTNWADDSVDQVWLKNVVDPGTPYDRPDELFGATPAGEALSPAARVGHTAENCNDQLGRTGPWYDRIPHFRLDYTPSFGSELQSEYHLARAHTGPAFAALRRLGPVIAPLLIVSEIRTVAADDLWMSPFHDADCVSFHFTWQPRQAEVEAVLPQVEAALAAYDARPHWGKVFHRSAGFETLFPRLADFRTLAAELDPRGVFRNAYLDRVLGPR
jgi:xylitol oxidase